RIILNRTGFSAWQASCCRLSSTSSVFGHPSFPSSDSEGHSMRRAFTLVELLIAMALTLILVYAVAQFYAFVGESVRDGRAQIEMGGQLRAASQRLQDD